MPKTNTAALEEINKMISGLTIGGMEELFRDPKFKKAFKDLTKAELKKIKIDADVSGIKDVKELEAAFKGAMGASENYFKKLDNYRSATQALSLAFREGSTHMSEYLKNAQATGGKMAVISAASLYLAKSFTEQMESLRSAALAARQYRIEQDMFTRTSNYSKKSLDGFRDSLNLTKSDMLSLYDVLGKMESQGFGLDQIEATFSALKNTYGPEGAMSLIKDWQQIMEKLPTMAAKRGGGAASTGDIYNMMASGSFSSYLKVKSSGGKSEAAELANHDKFVEARLESLKDATMNKIPTILFDVSKGIGLVAAGVGVLMPMYASLGAIQAMVAGIAAKSGIPGIGGAGGFGGKVGRVAGKFGTAAVGVAGTATLIGGIAAATIGGVTEIMRRTYGKSQHGYTPGYKEMFEAVKKYGLSYGGFSSEDVMTSREKKAGASLSGKTRISKAFESMQMFEDRWNTYYQDMEGMNKTLMDIAIKTGYSNEFQKNILEYSGRVNKEYSESADFYQKQIDKIEAARKAMESTKSFGEEAKATYEAGISKARKGLAETQKNYFESIQYILEKEAEDAVVQGGYGFARQAAMKGRVAGAGVGVARAELGGGDVAALREQRAANIEIAKSDVIALKNLKKKLEERKKEAKSEKEIRIIDEELIKNDDKLAQAIGKVNDAVKDTSDLDAFNERLISMHGVLGNLKGLISETNGSFGALQQYMVKDIEFAKEQERIAKEKYDRLVKEGGAESKPAQLAMDEWKNKQIAVAEEMFNYSKQERDMRLSEIDMQVGWQREQADFYSEMGGHFGDVLSMRSKAVQNERESIGVLEKYLSSGMLSGKEKMSAEIELERKKMNITRESIGIQKDAYEKFVGMAFGQLGDVGFKRGRMDASVLMGTANTRVKNKAGMFVGGGVGLNRDQMTALTATGFGGNEGGNYGGYTEPDLVRGEMEAKKASGLSSKEAQKVDVQTRITVEPSKEFNVIIKETVVNVMKTMGKSWGRTN